MPKIVIAAGGTAGHVVPALAIAQELRASGADVSFVGTRDRVEAELVPAAGFPLAFLNVTGLDRRHPGRALMSGVRAGAAAVRSVRLLRRLGADAVLASGGYVAGPVGLAAVALRTPLVLTESDSRLGLANRLLARFARRVCLSFPIAGREQGRYLVTGRPVPRALLDADSGTARERLGLEPDAVCVFVFGGSLGALSINTCAVETFAASSHPSIEGRPLVVLHVSGRRDYPELEARLARLGNPAHYRLHDYLENFADALAAADVVVARAGGSVFELAAAGKPSVLVPYPHATAAHQSSNAGWLERAGAAVVIPDDELDPERLSGTVTNLLNDPARLGEMAAAARRFARPDAAKRVAAELLEAAGQQRDAPWRGRRLHFVGIGGAGMSGLALVARRLGAEVSGCDRADSPYMIMLRAAGIEPELGHSESHVGTGTEVVVSTAIPPDAPDLVAAHRLAVPLIHRGGLLAEVAALRRLIAVAGTHGKTTTAAMTAHCLLACGLDPGFVVGAELRAGEDSKPVNAALGQGGWLVAEADESDRSFLELSPEIAVLTNVELDHHTTYRSLVELQDAFRAFLARVGPKGTAVVWDRPELRGLVPSGRDLIGYDIEEPDSSSTPDLSAREVRQLDLGMRFTLARSGRVVCEVTLPVPGAHNVLDALAALAASELAGCDLEQAARSLEHFRAAARRFEPKGARGGVRVFDDYAHHPTEVGATLEAARALEPRRLIAVFQPHLYSRTLHLYRELGRELARADMVVVLDVYPARERPEGKLAGVTGKLVADACADQSGGRPVWWLPTLEEAESVLSPRLVDGDVVVTLGAGDVDQLADRLAESLDGTG